jgi:hypothetical protein
LGYFFHGKSYVLIFTKIAWAIFWATFSQTRSVTLLARIISAHEGSDLKNMSPATLKTSFFQPGTDVMIF